MNEIEDLFPFYALGALTDDERREVEAYVARDPAAKARLDEMLATTDMLPYSAGPVQPSGDVKRALLDRVRAGPAPSGTGPAPRPGFFQTLRSLLASPAFSLAALALVVAAFLWGAGQAARAGGLAKHNEELQRTVAALMAENELLQGELGAQREVLALFTDPNRLEIPVAGTEAEPGALGTLFIGQPGDNRAVFLASDLPALPAGFVYQFWLIRGDTPVGAGLFSANAQGQGLVVVLAETGPVLSFDAVGVSIEPAGGSTQPTGDIVLLGMLPSG